jgi:AraC-like DNA-binding protein
MQTEAGADAPGSIPFYADGCPGVMFVQSDHDVYFNDTRKLPSFFYYGQTVKPIRLTTKGAFRMIILYFYPYATGSLFGLQPSEFTDDCLAFDLLPYAFIGETTNQLLETTDLEKQKNLLTAFIREFTDMNLLPADNSINHAVNRIIETGNQEPLHNIWKELCMTERTFQRKFEQHVGITPKQFARIVQFQETLQKLHDSDYGKLSDIAYDKGYSDQSHFIRSFRQFTGTTPAQFLNLTA